MRSIRSLNRGVCRIGADAARVTGGDPVITAGAVAIVAVGGGVVGGAGFPVAAAGLAAGVGAAGLEVVRGAADVETALLALAGVDAGLLVPATGGAVGDGCRSARGAGGVSGSGGATTQPATAKAVEMINR